MNRITPSTGAANRVQGWLGGLAHGLVLLAASAAATAAAPAATPPARAPQAVSDEARANLLQRASDAVIGVEARAVQGARSAETLGPKRSGSGIVVGPEGLVLTIGYLILEADSIDLVLDDRRRVPARPIAYDLATGFGLVKPLLPLPVQAVPLGTAGDVKLEEALMVASGGEQGAISMARLLSRRSFAGYWEYHIEGALFTAPARGDHSGAGLFNDRGELVGVGSLYVADASGTGDRSPGNMFVPVDLLKPIFTELRERGASRASTRPWLGVNCAEADGIVRVIRVSRDSPAEDAGLQPGDEIARVDGTEVHDLETFYKTLWKRSTVEGDVRIDINRGSRAQSLTVRSIDRMKALVRPGGI
jgi:serine protease Do